jgi:hypothetical protein
VNRKRNQHFIPCVFLSGFTDPADNSIKNIRRRHIWTYDFLNRTYRYSTIENVAFQKDFYEGFNIINKVENLFENIETSINPILENIKINLVIPNGRQYCQLIEFLSTLLCRTKLIFDRYEKILSDTKVILDKRFGKGNFNVEEDFLKLLTGESNIKLNTMFGCIHSLLPALFNRNWTILRRDTKAPFFFTGDNAAILEPPDFDRSDSHIIIPISRDIALSGNFYSRSSQILTISSDEVDYINSHIRWHSHNIYSPVKENYINQVNTRILIGSDCKRV